MNENHRNNKNHFFRTRIVCDIVIPVYNGLTYVRECVYSVLENTDKNTYRLFIINDAGDTHTADFLNKVSCDHPQIEVFHNQRNLGFVRSCNKGFGLGNSPFTAIVNSDVVVTQNWLSRLVACALRDRRIAVVNPLTNRASQIDIPIPSGLSFKDVNNFVQERFSSCFADIVTGVGFCMLIRRKALEEVGPFDEIFGHGYCEESDFCMRLTTSGWRTVVAKDVYVYHKGSASFTRRDERYLKNRKIFDSRWDKEYRRQFSEFLTADPLKDVRATLRPFTLKPDPKPVIVRTGREVLTNFRQGRIYQGVKASLQGAVALPRAKRELVKPDSLKGFKTKGSFSVTYVLHNLVVAGGVLSVIQIVNALIRQGVDARIAALYQDPLLPEWTRLYTTPMIYRTPAELIENIPASDILVATLWTSADWVRRAAQKGKANTTVYFLQDYEPWFFPPEKPGERRKVEATYSMSRYHIVKSQWLQDMVARHNIRAYKISLGMDLGVFYPRDVKSGCPVVVAMARPRTPRRGFSHIVSALKKVKDKYPDAEVVLFGERNLRNYNIPFEFTDAGIIFDQNRLAELYSRADVFLDGSDFQGFGRCALEAMACGCSCVLTCVGGVGEYAKHEKNCLLVKPSDFEAMGEAVIRLLGDPNFRERLIQSGFKTAQRFCHLREAEETRQFFQKLLLNQHSS